jgi:hypothetical protein
MRADVAKLVCADIEARASFGERKYGERLTTHNGRRGLQDAYEEALDLCMYLRQVLEERADIVEGDLQNSIQHSNGGSEDSAQICPNCRGSGDMNAPGDPDHYSLICTMCNGTGKLRHC